MSKICIKKNWILILIAITLFGCNVNKIEKEVEENFPVLTGKYLGQKEPGLEPEIFAPNIISTGMAEINAVFSPDFKEFYYSIRIPNGQLVIMVLTNDGAQWSEPKVASFSGEYSDADPFISHDGNWLYFISKRPVDSKNIAKSDWDIWRTHKDGDHWSEPERLENGINSEADETYPSLTKNGKLYFSSGRIGKNNKDIFCAEKAENGFHNPVRLNDTINSHWEGDVFISSEEDYMIFSSYGREAGSGLYITFNNDGSWNLPQRMSEEINVTGREFCPIVSPDGKYFFFTSNQPVELNNDSEKLTYKKIKDDFIQSYNYPQRGKTDIYWVSIKIIDNYRKQQ
ncbi:MAG: PD40 domain-containing protein [Bacteroidales bacterium]|nr:PD40 domain-containing protein [Bacteroidales bacterium]